MTGFVSVTDSKFGAVGDGIADDTTAIRNAVKSGAGRIHFPSGIYRITGQITIPLNVHIVGDGVDASVVTAEGVSDESLKKNFPDKAIFYFTGGIPEDGSKLLSPYRGFQPLPKLSSNVQRFDVNLTFAESIVQRLSANDVIVIHDPNTILRLDPKSISNEFAIGEIITASSGRVEGTVLEWNPPKLKVRVSKGRFCPNYSDKSQDEITGASSGAKAKVEWAGGSYNEKRYYYNAGEFLQINEVNEVNEVIKVRIVGSVQADYTAAHVEIYKLINPTRSSIREMTIIGPNKSDDDAVYCLTFRCGRGVTVANLRLTGTHGALCSFRQCFGVLVDNVEADQIFPFSTLSGLNYGIAVHNCQDLRVVNCRIVALRHAIAIGGYDGTLNNPNPVNRQITVANCDLKITGDAQALDAHGNTEFYLFENNRIHGGISFGGNFGQMIGNDIYGRNETQAAIALYASEWKGTDFEICHNRIHTRTTSSFKSRGAVFLYIDEYTVMSGLTIITANSIYIYGSDGDCHGLRVVNPRSMVGWELIIDNNYFYTESSGIHLFVERRAGTAQFNAVLVRNNTFRNGRIIVRPEDSKQLVLTGN